MIGNKVCFPPCVIFGSCLFYPTLSSTSTSEHQELLQQHSYYIHLKILDGKVTVCKFSNLPTLGETPRVSLINDLSSYTDNFTWFLNLNSYISPIWNFPLISFLSSLFISTIFSFWAAEDDAFCTLTENSRTTRFAVDINSPSSPNSDRSFHILTPSNPSIHKRYVVQKQRSTDFKAVKMPNVRSGCSMY